MIPTDIAAGYIYEGSVYHERVTPIKHRFRYSLFMVYLDLASLDDIFKGRLFWSTHRCAPARFRREDHLGDPSTPLDAAVRTLVQEQTGECPEGPIRLLTHLRYWGYVLNPVSFYFCFGKDEKTLEYVVLEVHNTPWGETHPYVVKNESPEKQELEINFDKTFHVSPFMSLDITYRLRIRRPDEEVRVELENIQDGEMLFKAALMLRQKPITTWNLARLWVIHPFMTGKILAAIYVEALRLWWKGAVYFPYNRATGNI